MTHREEHNLSPAVQVRNTLFVNQHHSFRECPLSVVCRPVSGGKPKADTGVPTYLYDRFHNGYFYRTDGGGSFINPSGNPPDFIYTGLQRSYGVRE